MSDDNELRNWIPIAHTTAKRFRSTEVENTILPDELTIIHINTKESNGMKKKTKQWLDREVSFELNQRR